MDVFAGLDDIDWHRMNHAYGPATEVPELIRGLVDPDPAVREVALDGMYGAVHHQGDVYRCTLEAIPFLVRLAAAFDLPGRDKVVELLASIGGVDVDAGPNRDQDRDGSDEDGRSFDEANRLVAAEHALLVQLLGDDDALVRAAAAGAVVVARERRPQSLRALRERFVLESDHAVRVAIVEAVAEIARRGTRTDDLAAWLSGLVVADASLEVRLTALSHAGAVDAPVADVPTALELLSALYARGAAATPPAGFTTDTLIGAVRRMHEEARVGRHAPDAGRLVRSVSAGFGDRVEDRVELLSALLRSPDGDCRFDALGPAQKLVEGWRGDHNGLVRLMGDQLNDDHPGLRSRAADVLQYFDVLAAPAGDALVAGLDRAPRQARYTEMRSHLTWLVLWDRDLPSPGPAIRALAGARDPRALPMLEWLLWQQDMPPDTGYLVGKFGASAAGLLPSLRRRLHELPSDKDHSRHRSALCFALRRLGDLAADALPELLDLPITNDTAAVFGSIGSVAAAALPTLREAATSDDRILARAAATAVYQISADPTPGLATAARLLALGSWDAVSALGLLKDLDEAAAPFADRVRGHLSADSPGAVLAAHVVWRAERDPAAIMPVLTREWAIPSRRPGVAAVWAEMGPAASAAEPHLRQELTSARRHNVSDTGWSSAQIPDDLALLSACHAALDRLTGRIRPAGDSFPHGQSALI